MMGGVEIHQAKADFMAGDRLYPAGSFVVKMAQPYKPYAWALLEKQKYPDMRQYPGGPPQPPYDNAGWTLPLQMGVACDQIKEPFEAKLEKIGQGPLSQGPGRPGPGRATSSSDSQINVSYPIAFALLKDAKAEVWRTKAKIADKGLDIPAGSFIVKNSARGQEGPARPARKVPPGRPRPATTSTTSPRPRLKFHRVGLYQSWRGNMDEGWTRYMFDDLGIPYKTLHNEDFKGTKEKKPDLRADYDVIVFADENADDHQVRPARRHAGGAPAAWARAAPAAPRPRGPRSRPLRPSTRAASARKASTPCRRSSRRAASSSPSTAPATLAISEFDAPARNALPGVDRTKFFCPTSILRILVDNETPIGYGMPKEAAAMFVNSLAFDTSTPGLRLGPQGRGHLSRRTRSCMSGWLLGEDIPGPQGRGRRHQVQGRPASS